MVDDKEYKKLVKQKSNAQSQYNACSNRIEECEYSLRRLRPVKEILVEQKSSFSSLRKTQKNIVGQGHEWEGETFRSFNDNLTVVTENNDYYYVHTLDRILDALNDEITRLENQKMNEYGLLGRLGTVINSLSNEIENFFN